MGGTVSEQKIGESVCQHNVSTSKQCVECRMDLSHRRLMEIGPAKDKASVYEKAMHLNDIKLFTRMIVSGKRWF